MTDRQAAKAIVQRFYADLGSHASAAAEVMQSACAPDLLWRGMHPFGTIHGPDAVAAAFWTPLRTAFRDIQRREQVFFAGTNHIDGHASTWVVSMGHLLGLFDAPFLGIAPTRKATFLRYADFHRVENEQIVETACYVDIMDFLLQAGRLPLATPTGANVLTLGPRTQDGLLHARQPDEVGETTLNVLNAMLDDLIGGGLESPEEDLARSWTEDMVWFGPAGIGTTYTRPRYREQHAGPFEETLEFVRHNGHQCRVAEGHYAAFFGYPSLTMKMRGGFLGLPASAREADMRIVDVYRREGDKLAENWIFIDVPHFLLMQGIDVLTQARSLPAR
ncbi:MAG: ester cyclase [Pseudomonadota bacterium]